MVNGKRVSRTSELSEDLRRTCSTDVVQEELDNCMSEMFGTTSTVEQIRGRLNPVVICDSVVCPM